MAKKVAFDFGGNKKSKKNLKKGLAIGATLGAALGAMSAALLTPKSGKQTREQIKTDAKKVSENIKSATNQVKESAEKAGNAIVEKAKSYKKDKACCSNVDNGAEDVQVEAAVSSENEEVK